MAWLRTSRSNPQARVRLFWLIRDRQQALLFDEVTRLAQQAGVEPVIHESRREGRVDPDVFFAHKPQVVALCGRPSLAASIAKHPLGRNCPIEQEIFAWR